MTIGKQTGSVDSGVGSEELSIFESRPGTKGSLGNIAVLVTGSGLQE